MSTNSVSPFPDTPGEGRISEETKNAWRLVLLTELGRADSWQQEWLAIGMVASSVVILAALYTGLTWYSPGFVVLVAVITFVTKAQIDEEKGHKCRIVKVLKAFDGKSDSNSTVQI